MDGCDNAKPAAPDGKALPAGQKFLTNPNASGKIGNNREGDLVIGKYQK
jgi:hypothetical protein